MLVGSETGGESSSAGQVLGSYTSSEQEHPSSLLEEALTNDDLSQNFWDRLSALEQIPPLWEELTMPSEEEFGLFGKEVAEEAQSFLQLARKVKDDDDSEDAESKTSEDTESKTSENTENSAAGDAAAGASGDANGASAGGNGSENGTNLHVDIGSQCRHEDSCRSHRREQNHLH